MSWFVLRTAFMHEELVAKTIAAFGEPFRSFCPLHETRWVHRGVKRTRLAPLWATYVLADWQPRDCPYAWHRVMDLEGVSGIIGGAEPMPVREAYVAEWIDRADADGVVVGLEMLIDRARRGYAPGDQVRFSYGAFEQVVGTCRWVDGKGIRVQTEMFGRQADVYIPSGSGTIERIETPTAPQTGYRRRGRRVGSALEPV